MLGLTKEQQDLLDNVLNYLDAESDKVAFQTENRRASLSTELMAV